MLRSIFFTASLGTIFCLSTFACSDDETAVTPDSPDSGFDGASSGGSSGLSSSGGSSGGSSGAPSDAGDGGDGGGVTNAIRLANLQSAALDICIREGNANVPGPFDASQPAFKATSGIPAGAVSRWISIEAKNYHVRYVSAGAQDCNLPVADNDVTLAAFTPGVRLTMVVTPTYAGGFNQSKISVAGKDNLFVWQDGQNVGFVDADGGATTSTAYRDLTSIEPGLLGQLVRDPANATRAYKSAAGRVSVFASQSHFFVCDDEAPAVGHLAKCDADVRKP